MKEKKYMYQVKLTGLPNSVCIKNIFKPVYVYVSPELYNNEYELNNILTDFQYKYYKHMYNIDTKDTEKVKIERRALDNDKLDYVINIFNETGEIKIRNEYENLWLEDEVPKMYNQDYYEFKIDIIKWFYDTMLKNVPFRPAKELNHLECEELVNIFETLNDKENYVLIRRYFKNKDFTIRSFKSIAEELGVTAERVRQIEAKAIRKLKHPPRLRRFEYVFSSNKKELDTEYIEAMFADGVIFNYNNIPVINRDMSIDDLDLSVRSYNCLRRAGIKTLGDILDKDEDELARIHNLGKKSLKEVLYIRNEAHNKAYTSKEAIYKYDFQSFTKLMRDLCEALEQKDEVHITCKKENNDSISYYSNKCHRLFNFTITTYEKEEEFYE